MAFPLSAPRGRTARRALVALAGAAGILLATVPASAAPTNPATATEAAELIAARGHDLEALAEEFNEARENLAAQQAAAQAAQVEVERATAVLAEAQQSVRGVARSAYTGSGLNSFQALMISGSADEFVNRMSTLQMVAGHQNELLTVAADANAVAVRAQAELQASAAEAQRQYDAVSGQKVELERQIGEYRAIHDRLSAEEQRAVAAAAATAHASGAAHGSESAGSERASRGERTEPLAAASAPVVADGQAAQVAIDTAMAQRGKPYVWAAGGPKAFDCSGLTQYAFKAAGINLPHSSRMQSQMGRSVARGDLQPGDLVFFYSPVSHVGIYIGNGQMVHAPTSGDVVKVAPVDAVGGYAGARRIAA
ncbi:Cell wall-associated hydrolase, NlpC family [Blastococcus aggregatus]|uniref:Cell wall-associated hydrolase, NlpC family n=1 Tax=Blastococcus aggregatus TaxID=38502 RepID=A0A285VCF1_9ACTN|nr:C40 family peptidase [Blastococcus aggregatus]SOC51744.1 Cell wall-associated hydrolase, NlpC family [Blastococcus aggregatus]